jgi:hypothetical protein
MAAADLQPGKEQRVVYIISMNVMKLYDIGIIFLKFPYQPLRRSFAVESVPVSDPGKDTVTRHICIRAYMQVKSSISFSEIHEIGKPLDKWVAKCK